MKLKDQVERARLAGLSTFKCEYICPTCDTFERYASGVCIQCNRDRVKRTKSRKLAKQPAKRDSTPTMLLIHRAFNFAVNRS